MARERLGLRENRTTDWDVRLRAASSAAFPDMHRMGKGQGTGKSELQLETCPCGQAVQRDFFERSFFGTRTDYRKRTIAPGRNDMTTIEPKPGLRPIPTIHVLEAQDSPTAGLGSPTQAAQTDSHRIPP